MRCCCRAGPAALALFFRLLRLPLRLNWRLFLDHHTGYDRRSDAAVLPHERVGGNKALPLSSASLVPRSPPPAPAWWLCCLTAWCGSGMMLVPARMSVTSVRRILNGRTSTPEGRMHFTGYNPLIYKLAIWTLRRRYRRHAGRSTCADRHHQSRARCRRAFDRDRDLDRGRRRWTRIGALIAR